MKENKRYRRLKTAKWISIRRLIPSLLLTVRSAGCILCLRFLSCFSSHSEERWKDFTIFVKIKEHNRSHVYHLNFSASAYFYQGYEGDGQGYEQGDRVTDESPHCGRQALINPNAIYVAGLTVIDKDGTKGGEFNLQQYSRVRFEIVDYQL